MKKAIKLFLLLQFVFVVQVWAAPAPESFADLVDNLMPAVVNISSKHAVKQPSTEALEMPQFPEGSPFNDLFKEFFDRFNQGQGGGPLPPENSLGSGFIIGEDGLVVTNNHVIDEADSITVILHDNSKYEAKVLGVDPKTDLALLKIEPKKKLKAVKFGDSSKMRVGDWVVAIGNPFGLGGSVTAGIISARARDINSGPYDDYLQTDASINRGNSGGPMFNLNGEVIGINTAIFSPTGGSVGIGFAIPSEIAGNVIKQLQEHGRTRRGWLGVRIQEVTDEIADSLGLDKARGAMVAEVTPDGPSADAGIQQGDIILKFDGDDIEEMRELPRAVAETPVGKKVDVEVWRNGKAGKRSVKLGELEAAEQANLVPNVKKPKEVEPEKVGLKVLGMTLESVNGAYAKQMDIKATKGAVVIQVDPSKEAYEKGIMPGDVIVSVAQQEVSSPKEVEDKVAALGKAGKKSVLFLVQRGSDSRFVALKLAE